MESADALDRQVYNVVLFTLIPFVVAFAFIVFVLYRRRRESLFKLKETAYKLKEAELDAQVAEVEMKALRAQINPHFIFNCMNSVQEFMAKNDMKQAREYLENFTVLIRMTLENSMHKEISLKKDMDALCRFMEMEKARMKIPFDYRVEIDKAIDADNTVVAPTILQPFIENCIKHGFREKPSTGMIAIRIIRESDYLKFIIDDNGIEKKDAALNEPKPTDGIKTSLGLNITRERLEVISKTKNIKSYFNISDIRDEQHHYKGKRVELFMPFEEEF